MHKKSKSLLVEGDIYSEFQNKLTLHISVHPCDRDHGCAQTCIKESGMKFRCSCNEPVYKLATDGKNCDAGIYQCSFLMENKKYAKE